MSAPVIGVSGSHVPYPASGYWAGTRRAHINEDYVRSLAGVGAIPVGLPIQDPSAAEALVQRLDGLVLTGGADIDTSLYGQEPTWHEGPFNRARDDWDIALYRAAVARGIPVLGTCRGLQVIVVAEGGTLHQDLAQAGVTQTSHNQQRQDIAWNAVAHPVTIAPGSLLAGLVGERIDVNTFHHQAADALPDTLRQTATSDDGVVEAAERTDGWVLGVQWHPERSFGVDQASTQIFAGLAEAAAVRMDTLR